MQVLNAFSEHKTCMYTNLAALLQWPLHAFCRMLTWTRRLRWWLSWYRKKKEVLHMVFLSCGWSHKWHTMSFFNASVSNLSLLFQGELGAFLVRFSNAKLDPWVTVCCSSRDLLWSIELLLTDVQFVQEYQIKFKFPFYFMFSWHWSTKNYASLSEMNWSTDES